MKKALFLILALTLSSGFVHGEGFSLDGWLKQLQAKLQQTEQKQKKRLQAVAAVRGSKEDGSAKKLYWKGKQTSSPVSQAEVDEFKAAVALAQEGKNADAEKSLNDFMAKHPESAFNEDAKQTLALLKEPASAPSTETPSPESK